MGEVGDVLVWETERNESTWCSEDTKIYKLYCDK